MATFKYAGQFIPVNEDGLRVLMNFLRQGEYDKANRFVELLEEESKDV